MRSLTTLEPKRHGDSLFPLAVYDVKYPKNSIILDLHWHSELEFLVVTRGAGIFQIDGTELEVEEGQAIIISGGTLHRARTKENRNCSFIAVVFDPQVISGTGNDRIKLKYIDPVLESLRFAHPVLDGKKEIESSIIEELKNINKITLAKEPMYELNVKIGLLKVFSHLYLLLGGHNKKTDKNSAYNNKSKNIKEALLFIHKNYSRAITLNEISLEAGMSEAYFCRTFKMLVDKTVFEYINYYRINISTNLLIETTQPISIIGNNVGYESTSYFIKQFKKVINITPKVYRKTRSSIQPGI